MTKDQQAALEQAAREWLIANEYGCWRGDELLISPEDVRRLSLLLAAQRAKVLEEVEKEIKGRRCELGLKLYPSRPLFGGVREKYEGQDEALRLLEGWISRKAQEQRP